MNRGFLFRFFTTTILLAQVQLVLAALLLLSSYFLGGFNVILMYFFNTITIAMILIFFLSHCKASSFINTENMEEEVFKETDILDNSSFYKGVTMRLKLEVKFVKDIFNFNFKF